MNQDIEYLKKIKISNMEFVSVTFEESGIFEENGECITELPPFYRALLCARPGQGSEIYIEVWLPKDWNGIFLGLGNGGMAGRIWHRDLGDRIKQGYVAACTDMGTARGRSSGVDNPDVWKDFGWRATHLMTIAGKALLHRLYGEEERYAYFIGSSTGGQQALAEAQRFPFVWSFGEDYDGFEFDFDKDVERLNSKLAEDLNANVPELSAFKKNGGKLMIYSGSADPCVPYPDAMNYYCRMLECMGGYRQVKEFCRYFLFPGKDHGVDGMGTNAIWADKSGDEVLTALRRWREEGKPPESLIAVGYCGGNPENGISFLRNIEPFGSVNEDCAKCPPACSAEYLNRKY